MNEEIEIFMQKTASCSFNLKSSIPFNKKALLFFFFPKFLFRPKILNCRFAAIDALSGDISCLLGSWASPFAMRVQVALKLKCVEYEFVEENFYSDKSERLLKANPVHKKIPVLIHDEKPICESLIIIQYIDDSWTDGPPILPSDPYDRATARFWAAYVDQTWFVEFKELEKASGDEERAKVIAKIYEGLALLETVFVKSSKGGDFFGGDNVGYVDIVLGSYLGWIKVTELMVGLKLLDETKTPGLAKWGEKIGSHDMFKDVLPEPQKLIEFYMMVQSAKASS